MQFHPYRLIAWAALASGAHVWAQAPVPPPPSTSKKIDFNAPPQNHTITLVAPKSGSTTNPIQMTFKGWMYMPEGLSMSSPDVEKFPREERRLTMALKESRLKGIEAVVPFWAPAEQANIKKNVTDPNVMKGITTR